jgi:transketolase
VAFIQNKAVQLGKHIVYMTSTAGSGHPSSGLSLVHIVTLLLYEHMRWDPNNPWDERSDRLVLSEGHAVPVVYAAYADLGGKVGRSPDTARTIGPADLDGLRRLDSELDGHPNPAEGFHFFDAATGSLGQGLGIAAGLAAAGRLHGLDKRIFVIIGDGEAREGQVWEAADFIVDHRLTNVCAIFNCNGEGQAEDVSPQQGADTLAAKLASFGWEVARVDGHDPEALDQALLRAGEGARPTAIVAETVKGWGVPTLQEGNWHGKPVPKDRLNQALAELDETLASLKVSSGVRAARPKPPAGVPVSRSDTAGQKIAPFAEACERAGFGDVLAGGKLATRKAYGAALLELGRVDSRIVALDGDVKNSTFSEIFADRLPQRFFECKIAEQNMVSVAVGLAAGGTVPFVSSFGKFLARAYDQVEIASLTRANVKLVGSHCGVSLGADGPSQMALPDVAYFRSFCRVEDGCGGRACTVFLPSDAVSAYRLTELMARHDGLCYMRTHRPDVPLLYSPDSSFEIGGCKQLRKGPDLTLVGSGYMVGVVLRAADSLGEAGIECNVFDAYCLPLEAGPILQAARGAGGRIIIVEDNYAGGVHAELAEAAAAVGDVRVEGMTCRRIPKSGRTADDVLGLVGLAVEDIVAQARS